MTATVHVRTVQFLDAVAADDDYGVPRQPLPKRQSELAARSMGRSGGGEEVTWFKDNRLGHRQQAAYLLRLERLRQELHDAEQGHRRDSLDRLFGTRRPAAAAAAAAIKAAAATDALAPPLTFVTAAAIERRLVGTAAAAAGQADKRGAPWLARSPEEHALLESVRDGARKPLATRQRSSDPPVPTVKRLLAAAEDESANKASAAQPPQPQHDTATSAALWSGKETSVLVGAHAHQALAYLRAEPAATGYLWGLSPPCAPTIPTLNRTPARLYASVSSGESIDARGRSTRTAPACSSGGGGGQHRAKLTKRGSFARALTAIKATAGGGERRLPDAALLVVPGKRMPPATPAAFAGSQSASFTPRDADDVAAPFEFGAAEPTEAGFSVVMPDAGARAMSSATDSKCESATMQRHGRDSDSTLGQRMRSVAFVEDPSV